MRVPMQQGPCLGDGHCDSLLCGMVMGMGMGAGMGMVAGIGMVMRINLERYSSWNIE